MTKRRSRGDGGLHWDEQRQRWIATITISYDGRGKRMVRKASDRTKSGALAKLKEAIRDREDGLAIGPSNYTVGDAVRNWLDFGLRHRDPATARNAGSWPTSTLSRPSAPASCASCRPTTPTTG